MNEFSISRNCLKQYKSPSANNQNKIANYELRTASLNPDYIPLNEFLITYYKKVVLGEYLDNYYNNCTNFIGNDTRQAFKIF